ncbi:hypothetical protein HPB51_017977 [Rhipicephalus microplus]|uniref:Uncharacterized protein n=1 Tax=Rhipicephalus microplus TaxID=6941 RepID=A0A9J6D5X4_RHIMP|nr:hypothetical protein HPB51_017977 [Rhipicephalus microplus]
MVPEKLSVDLMVTEVLPVKYTRELKVTELPAEKQTVEAQVAELPFEKQRQGPEVTGALIAVIDQEGYSGVLEEFNESSEKQTQELKVTELPTGKRIPLSEGTKVAPEEQPLDLKIMEVPPEKHTPELKVAELPAEKQTVEAEVAQLPVEEQTQVPEVADGLITVIDQEGYSGVLEEYYKSAEKRTPEPEPEKSVYAGTPPSLDVHEEAKLVVVDYAYAVATETPEEKQATAKENERQKGEYAAEVEAEDKEPHPKKSFDVREERRRQSEQRWKKVPIVKGAQESAATVKYKEVLQMPERTALTATRAESAEIRDKTFAEKQSSENVVRRLITAAIEEAAKREAAKSVKRFKEFPCTSSTEDASKKLRSSSSDTSTSERASRRKQEHRFADVKVQQENEKDMPLAELIEEMIQTHVGGSNINKHRLAREKQGRAQDFARARAPGIPPNIGQQQIPVYYQTAATTPRLGDQYVEDNRPSLLSAPRKSDTQLASSSRTEHRLSFSTLGGRGGRCVIRKLEPGALTYLVEVSPPDKNQENQTDMVMAEEQMLVSEIFDHITTPTMRVSSSGTTLNELAPITVSPAASLTAIRNAYAEAVARRVLGNQLYKSNEGVLSASQKAKFYESGLGVNLRKTASSTSVYSVPSVESYIVQSMLDGGVINSHKDLWSKRPAEFGSAIVSRSRSLDALANTETPTGTIAVPLPTPRDAEHEALVDMGSGNGVKMAAQASREETPQYEAPTEIRARDEAHLVAEGPTEDAPGHATLENVIHETDTTPNWVETEQITGAAGSADGHEGTRSSSFPSNNGTIRGPERTAAADTAIATAQKQRSWVNLTSSENLNNTVDIDWNECVCCKKYTPPDKSFESFICFGLHETPKYFASVPPGVSDCDQAENRHG